MGPKKPLPASIDHISYMLGSISGRINHFEIKYLIRIEDGTQRVSCPRYEVLDVAFTFEYGGYKLCRDLDNSEDSSPYSEQVLQWVLDDLNRS